MPKITVLPHDELCPGGAEFECRAGAELCDQLRANGIGVENACEKSCVCTTCHVLVRKGFSSLRPAGDAEETSSEGLGSGSDFPVELPGNGSAARTS